MITVWVPGVAKTKGSMTVQRGRRLAQSVQGSEEWAELVRRCTVERIRIVHGGGGRLAPKPVIPKGIPVAVRLAFWLPVADVTAERSGDVDKLARNVLDALTKAGAYADDVQVVKLHVDKYPASDLVQPGLLLRADPLPGKPDDGGLAALQARNAMRDQGLLPS